LSGYCVLGLFPDYGEKSVLLDDNALPDPWLADLNYKLVQYLTCGSKITSTSKVKMRDTDNRKNRPTHKINSNHTLWRTKLELKTSKQT
jgi:hypothetical protein